MQSNQGRGRWVVAGLLVVLTAVFFRLGRRTEPPVPPPSPPPVAAAPVDIIPAPVPEAEPGPVDPDFALARPAGEFPPTLPPLPEVTWQLPTDNTNLLTGKPEDFYMFVDRYQPTGVIQVWEGGCYGFVRNRRETAHGTVFTRFHEGIDILPAQRDSAGEPLDEVRAVADGTVVYVTASARTSNYGNYVVVLHEVPDAGRFFSLYAHLKSAAVTAGTVVTRGMPLGMLGHTGSGIDQRRAHVHLEIGLVLSERFDEFYARTSGHTNPHGNYHGSNLIGFNGADFLSSHARDPRLLPDAFLREQEVYYKVRVPARGHELEIVEHYPWLRQAGPSAVSWEISFTGPGVPVRVAPASQETAFPTVAWVKPYGGYHSWNTRSLLGGSGNTATLTAAGNQFINLVTGDF